MAVFYALLAAAAASVVFGVMGLIERRRLALAVAVGCGLGFSFATGFSIDFWALLWPTVLLGQLVMGASRPAYRWIALGAAGPAWAAFL